MGISPAFALACRKQGIEPGRQYDLSSLRSLTVAGSPLPVDGFEWIYEQVDASVLLINGSGGTDVCSGIVQGCPLLPVYAGEIAGRCLGVDVAAFDEHGEPVVGELGELVIRQPMPSMAVEFWNDPGDERYRAAYFDHYPGIWRHGDWIMFTERGSCVITGRSDATLNRGGVRLGTSEFYSALEELDEVRRQPGRPPRGGGRADPLRRPARGPRARRRHAQAHRGRASRRALAASRAGHDRRAAGDPADAHRQEARAAGQADPHRRPRGRGGQPATRSSIPRRSSPSSPTRARAHSPPNKE